MASVIKQGISLSLAKGLSEEAGLHGSSKEQEWGPLLDLGGGNLG